MGVELQDASDGGLPVFRWLILILEQHFFKSEFYLFYLVVDPLVSSRHAILKGDSWLPPQILHNESVIAIAPSHPLGCICYVGALEGNLSDLLNDVDELVNSHQLGTSDVHWITHVTGR